MACIVFARVFEHSRLLARCVAHIIDIYCILLFSCQRLVPAMPLTSSRNSPLVCVLVVEFWFFPVRCCCWLSFGNFIVFRLFPTPQSSSWLFLFMCFICLRSNREFQTWFSVKFSPSYVHICFLILFFIHSSPSHENIYKSGQTAYVSPVCTGTKSCESTSKLCEQQWIGRALHCRWATKCCHTLNTIILYMLVFREGVFYVWLAGWLATRSIDFYGRKLSLNLPIWNEIDRPCPWGTSRGHSIRI